MKKPKLWFGGGFVLLVLTIFIFWLQSARSSTENLLPKSILSERQRTVRMVSIEAAMAELGIGHNIEFWSAFYIYSGHGLFPLMFGRILDVQGRELAEVRCEFFFPNAAAEQPDRAKVFVRIPVKSLEKIVQGSGKFSRLVKDVIERSAPLPDDRFLSRRLPDGSVVIEVTLALSDSRTPSHLAYENYFEKTHPALFGPLVPIVGDRAADNSLTEPHFVASGSNGLKPTLRLLVIGDRNVKLLVTFRPIESNFFETSMWPIPPPDLTIDEAVQSAENRWRQMQNAEVSAILGGSGQSGWTFNKATGCITRVAPQHNHWNWER